MFLVMLKQSIFFQQHNFRDEYSAGRCYVFLHCICQSIVSLLINGVFFSKYLQLNGINIVNVGIISLVPHVAMLFTLVSPAIMRHFPRRKAILAVFCAGYYLTNIFGVPLLATLIQDPGGRLIGFCIMLFIANVINAIMTNAYVTWHVAFVPEEARGDYFVVRDNLIFLASTGTTILIALVADRYANSALEPDVIRLVRYIAFPFALLDLYFLCKPCEVPYPQSSSQKKVFDVFRLPLREKRFLLAIGIQLAGTFISSLPAGVLNYHLVNTIGIGFSYIYIIELFSCVFPLFFRRHWNCILEHKGLLKTFALCRMLYLPVYILYAFVCRENYAWLYLIMKLLMYYVNVGNTMTNPRLFYDFLPTEDQDEFIAFYNLLCDAIAALGILLGTAIVSWIGSNVLTLFGMSLTAVPVLLVIEAVLMALSGVLIYFLLPRIKAKLE